MAKIKISELASELGCEGKELIAFLQEKGIEAKRSNSSIEETDADVARKQFGSKAKEEKPKKEEKPVEKPVEKAAAPAPAPAPAPASAPAENGEPLKKKKKKIIVVTNNNNSQRGGQGQQGGNGNRDFGNRNRDNRNQGGNHVFFPYFHHF